MKKYIGTNNVYAKRMNRRNYNNFRGWDLPEDEDGTDEGYLVEYTDGGKPNTHIYEGYVTWFPKEQFDNAYKVADTFLDRLLIEKEELAIKVGALSYFLPSDKFYNLPKEDKRLLTEQNLAMHQYLEILNQRIVLAR